MCWREDRGLEACEGGVILKLPDVRQEKHWQCGEAAFRCVAAFFGEKGQRLLDTPIDGTDPRQLEAALWGCGLSVQSGSMDLADLKYHTGRGRPVVCLVTEEDGVGHYVVVGGVKWNTVHFHCPLDGWCRESGTSFEGRWRDNDRMGTLYLRWGLAVGP